MSSQMKKAIGLSIPQSSWSSQGGRKRMGTNAPASTSTAKWLLLSHDVTSIGSRSPGVVVS